MLRYFILNCLSFKSWYLIIFFYKWLLNEWILVVGIMVFIVDVFDVWSCVINCKIYVYIENV